MESYYTLQNLYLYFTAALLLLLLVPMAVLLREGRWPIPVRPVVWIFILATVSFPLSRTCPYPLVAKSLLYLSFVCSGTGFLILTMGTVRFVYRKRSFNFFPITQKEVNRWISHALRGTFLVTDPKGLIIGGHLKRIPEIPGMEAPGLSLEEFIKGLEPYILDVEDYKKLYINCPSYSHLSSSINNGMIAKNGSGSFQLGTGFYNWSLIPLGEKQTEGYLFAVQNLSEEYQLYKQREEQEQLLALRLERIKYQSQQAAKDFYNTQTMKTIEKSTDVLKAGLGELVPVLASLNHAEKEHPQENWERALKLSSATMKKLRKTVHEMDSHWRKAL